ncbi:MAG: hypothetical protein G8345_04350 [Magnetococcales bacterium]|nr:hypothetical protein [Magnetococcales bacterium]NGZ26102.1 hypothetical protein [Magnetococcales bacterium]
MMAETGSYRVLTRLRRNGQEHPVGEVVTLPPDVAWPLVKVGVLVEVVVEHQERRGRRRVER